MPQVVNGKTGGVVNKIILLYNIVSCETLAANYELYIVNSHS